MTLPRSLFIIAFVIAVFLPFIAVHAASVQWGSSVPMLAYHHPSSGECLPQLDAAHATITYVADAVDSEGASVCGGTVANGSTVTFKFKPHTYEDIYWFGTGFYSDSPYGDWIAGAAAPPVAGMCAEKNLYAANFQVTQNTWVDFYGTLAVDPPQKTLTGTNGFFTCGSLAADGTMTCTATTEGTSTPVFNFASTFGRYHIMGTQPVGQCTPSETMTMYPAGSISNAGGGRGWWHCTGGNTEYQLDVPAQQISCPIVIEDPDGDKPVPPTLSASGGAACIVGQPHTISMTSTDPDGDDIRYGIDWDNNGLIDQYIPGSGYVPSGTSQTASRTFALPGAKKVRVVAQDNNGLTSSSAIISFNCGASATAGLNEGNNDGDGFEVAPGSAAIDLTLRVIPSLVRSGNTTKVNWNASGVDSCTVTAPNGDSWNKVLSVIGGEVSSPINSEMVYTLRCVDDDGGIHTKNATVRVLPSWVEK